MKRVGKIQKAQTAVEYLVLLGVTTVIVLVGFKEFLPKVNRSTELYFNYASNAILGPPPLNGLQEAGRILYP